jgi:radical SAM protein with 4Fe4S-binding SPASM domain
VETTSKYVQRNEQVSTLCFSDVDKILSDFYGKRFYDYRKNWYLVEREFIDLDYPLHLDIEVSYKCNYKCQFCIFSMDTYDKSLPSFMDTDIYKKIIDESAKYGLPAIQTSYYGEPLVRKDLHELVGYARKKGIMDVFVTTNGALLTPSRAAELMDAGVSRIHISIDANSERSYDSIRHKGYFNKVLENVHALIKMKGKNALPIIRTSFCKNSINEHEADDFINYWRDQGVDQVAIQEYINIDPEKKHLFPQNRRIVKDFICLDPFRRLTIRSNGDILPCCTIYGSEIKLGNVIKDSIYDIWHSKKLCSLRDMIKKREYEKHPACRVCVKNNTGG